MSHKFLFFLLHDKVMNREHVVNLLAVGGPGSLIDVLSLDDHPRV